MRSHRRQLDMRWRLDKQFQTEDEHYNVNIIDNEVQTSLTTVLINYCRVEGE